MPAPTTRQEFITYCLRRLGFPVISIDVEEGQLSDRVDDALNKFFDYHFDGCQEEYLVVQISDQDVANGYITLLDSVFAVMKVLPAGKGLGAGTGSGGLFDVQYQFYMNDLYGQNNIIGSSLSYLTSMKQYLSTLQNQLTPLVSYNFNRKTNRITFNESLGSIKAKSPILVFKVLKQLSEDDFPDIWSDEFLKDYATALIKRQWGDNLKKFGNLNLPGGITINGEAIFTEASTEVERLETKLINDMTVPMDFLIG
jgi:hypothetical protein